MNTSLQYIVRYSHITFDCQVLNRATSFECRHIQRPQISWIRKAPTMSAVAIITHQQQVFSSLHCSLWSRLQHHCRWNSNAQPLCTLAAASYNSSVPREPSWDNHRCLLGFWMDLIFCFVSFYGLGYLTNWEELQVSTIFDLCSNMFDLC